jgi:hypothetical protein
VTPRQLEHLAEQADFAAGFYAVTNPAAARRFAEAATTARRLSDELDRRMRLAGLRAELDEVKSRLDHWQLRRVELVNPPPGLMDL